MERTVIAHHIIYSKFISPLSFALLTLQRRPPGGFSGEQGGMKDVVVAVTPPPALTSDLLTPRASATASSGKRTAFRIWMNSLPRGPSPVTCHQLMTVFCRELRPQTHRQRRMRPVEGRFDGKTDFIYKCKKIDGVNKCL